MTTSIDTSIVIGTPPLRRNDNSLFRLPLGQGDVFCDSEGEQPGSVLFGLSLEPVVRCPGSGDGLREDARFCDACGEPIEMVMPSGSSYYAVKDHPANADTVAAYNLDVQYSAIYFDVTKDQLVGLIAQLQRVLVDNADTWGPA